MQMYIYTYMHTYMYTHTVMQACAHTYRHVLYNNIILMYIAIQCTMVLYMQGAYLLTCQTGVT